MPIEVVVWFKQNPLGAAKELSSIKSVVSRTRVYLHSDPRKSLKRRVGSPDYGSTSKRVTLGEEELIERGVVPKKLLTRS